MGRRKPIYLLLLMLLIVISIAVAIKFQTPRQQSETAIAIGTPTQYIPVSINGNTIVMDFYSSGNWYDTTMLNTEYDTQITLGDFEGYRFQVNGIPVEPNASVDIRLESLRWEAGIEFSATNLQTGITTINYVRTLPSHFYEWQVLSEQPDDGYYYFNLNNYIYKISTAGDIVFFKAVQGVDNISGGMDFKRTEVDGTVYYSYLLANTPANRPALSGVGYGRMCAVVMNEQYEEIDHVYALIPNEDILENYPLENHQFTILGEKHYLISSYVGKRVTNIPDEVPHSALGSRVVAAVLQEIQDGKLIWQWDSTEHPELYALSLQGNDYYNTTAQWADYVHFNAIAIDPTDQNFLCSFRNLSAILKLDRKTGDVLWILGGTGDQFGLDEAQLFSCQHDVRITKDGAITIFNNGNADDQGQEGSTSIMKFWLDEKNKKVSSFEEYIVEGAFSPYMGSATEISDGHYIIGWGTRTSYSQMPLFSEIDFNEGKVLFEFIYPLLGDAYRVYKFEK